MNKVQRLSREGVHSKRSGSARHSVCLKGIMHMYIYVIRNKKTNKIYVGKTISSVRKRWANHIYESFTETSAGYNLYFHRSIRKHGKENFEFYKIYD